MAPAVRSELPAAIGKPRIADTSEPTPTMTGEQRTKLWAQIVKSK